MPTDPLTAEQIEAILGNRDYYLVVDKSGSEGSETDTPSGQTRWDYQMESLLAIATQLDKFDPDGSTLVTFAGSHDMLSNQPADRIRQVLKGTYPMGGTVMAPAFQAVFDDYLRNKAAGNTKPNGAILVCMTDGQPQDENAVAKAIVNFTKKLSDGREEFGIEILQVGRDAHATAFLERLNDNLAKEGAKYDIVNCIGVDDVEKIGLEAALYKSLSE